MREKSSSLMTRSETNWAVKSQKMYKGLKLENSKTNTVNNNEQFGSFKSKENIIRKKLGHTMVSANKASSVTL